MLSRGSSVEVALAEGLHPLAEGLLGAGREEDHADAGGGVLGEAFGRGRAGRRPRCRCRWRRGRPCASRSRPSPRSSRGRGRCRAWSVRLTGSARRARPAAGRRSPGPSAPGWSRSFSISPRRSAIFGSAGWKTRPEWAESWWALIDDRLLRVGVADLADDVVGGALAAAARAGGAGAGGKSEAIPAAPSAPRAPPRRRRPRSVSDPAERAERGADPERPPVGAVGTSRLDPRLGAELGGTGRPATRPRAARPPRPRAVDPLQFLQPRAQPGLVGRADRLCQRCASCVTGHVAGHATRLPLTDVRRRLDNPVPRPRDPHRGRLVLVPDPLPGHLLDVQLLQRPAGDVGQLDHAVPARPSLSAAGFFGSILLHELGHAVVARRNGIGISSIQLWIFGGMARMDREADSPGVEARVALAGPAVTFAIFVVADGRRGRSPAAGTSSATRR